MLSSIEIKSGRTVIIMIIEQVLYTNNRFNGNALLGDKAQWVLAFGDRKLIEDNSVFDEIRSIYPSAYIMGCSTAGEIQDNYITDGQLNLTAIHFEKSHAVFGKIEIIEGCNFYELGEKLAESIEKTDLKHVFLLTDGVNINGSKLVEGIKNIIGSNVPITGGLAGDGFDFAQTAVIANDYSRDKIIVYAAFYGKIKSGCAACGGWDTFGIERVVTKSEDNILYEIDNKPALDIYKEYLGEKAKDLPGSGLRFPMSFRLKNSQDSVIRTMLDIDEKNNSMIFRADIPQGSLCKLMKANNYTLVDAAKTAAESALKMLSLEKAELAVVVNCVGRRVVLKQRTEEEIENIRGILGDETVVTGYYSYGEIGPARENAECEMHNQTMTITLLSETKFIACPSAEKKRNGAF